MNKDQIIKGVGIYPRKSRKNDESDSMELQIDICKDYAAKHFPNAPVTVFDKDYALTGHSIKKRLDFQKMMDAVRNGSINVIIIVRYDRIARNMRDFCNLYYDIEQANCTLVSTSQTIDTSTPYGKSFMYQLAIIAELEWALISERYKDTIAYRIKTGRAYTGKLPYGFKIDVIGPKCKYVVHDENEKNVYKIIDHYKESKNMVETVGYVRDNIDPDFTYKKLRAMLGSSLYVGKCRDNLLFCPPYYQPEEWQQIQEILPLTSKTKSAAKFSCLIVCPICQKRLAVHTTTRRNNTYNYYRCVNRRFNYGEKYASHFSIRENLIEEQLLDKLESFFEEYAINSTPKHKEDNDGPTLEKLTKQLERINDMYELGTIQRNDYLERYKKISEKIAAIKEKKKPVYNIAGLRAQFSGNWKEVYLNLSNENKRIYWHNILNSIFIDENGNIIKVLFC